MSEARAMGAVDYQYAVDGDDLDSEYVELESVEVPDDVAQSVGLLDDKVEDLDGDARELSDYREVLADHQVSVEEWTQLDWAERLERVERMSYDLVHSDADGQLKNDAADCGEIARHLEVLPEQTLEYGACSLTLHYKLREMGYLVDEGFKPEDERADDQVAVDDVSSEEVDDLPLDVVLEDSLGADMVVATAEQGLAAVDESAVLDGQSLGALEETAVLEQLDVDADFAKNVLEEDAAELDFGVLDEVVDATLNFGEQVVDEVAEAAAAIDPVVSAVAE